MTTKDYNKLFLELLSRLHESAPGDAAPTLVRYLSGQTSESRRWPDDRELEHALMDLPLYRLLTRGRLRMVLEAIEDSMRTPLTEESHVTRGSLTIEHVLPQAWKEHWPLPDAASLEAELDRERLLHSLGNLTLVNERLNPALSNSPWTAKRDELAAHTVLHLNKALLAAYRESEWSEATVRARGAALAERVKTIWPAGGFGGG